MSISQQIRIERLEAFVERLVLGSHFAKAAANGTALIDHNLEPGDAALASAAINDPKRLIGLQNRLDRLEKKVDAMYDELGAHVLTPHPRQADANADANERAALGTLAKARSAVARLNTPDGLLERGVRVLTDPTAVGVLQSYVNGGQLKKAADLVSAAEANADKAAEDGALERVQDQMDEHSQLATLSKLGEAVADIQRSMSSLLGRLSKLESRSAAAPAPAQTVAKAARFGRGEPDPRNSAQGLMTRAEGVIDSPGRIGQISSLAQAGRLDEVRQIVEKAELAHESKMKARDRRFL